MIQPRPIYTDGDKYDTFKLVEQYVYKLSNGTTIIIPAFFETDFASIPQIVWNIYEPHDKRYRVPALVHDYLYMVKYTITSRAFADAEFRRMLIIEGVKKSDAWLFWLMVRIFGGKRFKNFKNHKIN